MSSTSSRNLVSSGKDGVLEPRIQIPEHGEFTTEDFPTDITDQLQQAAFDKESENTFVKRQTPVNGDGEPEIVEVKVEQNKITISVQDIVGIVNLTPSSKIQINPKIGWKEILDIFLEVQEHDRSIDYHGIPIRDFLSDTISIKDIFVVVAVNYLNSIDPIFRHGFIREFDTKRVDAFEARGRIDIERSLKNQTLSQGIPKHHFVQKVVNYSTPPNRVIYQAGLELRQLFQLYSDEYDHEGYYKVFSQLETVLREFESRDVFSPQERPSQLAEVSIYDLPRQRGYYQKALEISKTILSSSIGEPLDEGRENLTMDYILSMENLFEKYSHLVISNQIKRLRDHPFHDEFEDVTVEKESHPLFEETSDYNQQPDHMIRQEGDPIAILDTKYYSEEKDPLKDTYARSRLLGYGYQFEVDQLGFLCPLGKQSENVFAGRAGGLKVVAPEEFSIESYERGVEEYLRDLFGAKSEENPHQILENGRFCHAEASIESLDDVIGSEFLQLDSLQESTKAIVQHITGGESERVHWRNDTAQIVGESRSLRSHLQTIPDKYDRVLPLFFRAGDELPAISRRADDAEEGWSDTAEEEHLRFYCFRFNDRGQIRLFEEENPYIFNWG